MNIGIIGGTGLYELAGFEIETQKVFETPFGSTSSAVTIARRDSATVCFLARHGDEHKIMPGQVNYRANIWSLKSLGCSKVLAIGAVGSLQENIHPGEFCIPDQFIDRTFLRSSSFFDRNVSAYVSMAEPFCIALRNAIGQFLHDKAIQVHKGGSYVVMEGPQLSTRAESEMHRQWGASIIGMTLCPEAKLAREAEIAYCPLAMVSDYDCWHTNEAAVTAESALAVLSNMSMQVKEFLPELVDVIAATAPSEYAITALSSGLVTDLSTLTSEVRERLEPILARML